MTNEEVLNAFANKMLNAVDGIEAFGKEQIPDFIEQVLVYNFWESVATSTILFMIVFVFIAIAIASGLRMERNKNWDSPLWVPMIVLPFACIFMTASIYAHAKIALKIKLAPKVYIVDYLRNQIN